MALTADSLQSGGKVANARGPFSKAQKNERYDQINKNCQDQIFACILLQKQSAYLHRH